MLQKPPMTTLNQRLLKCLPSWSPNFYAMCGWSHGLTRAEEAPAHTSAEALGNSSRRDESERAFWSGDIWRLSNFCMGKTMKTTQTWVNFITTEHDRTLFSRTMVFHMVFIGKSSPFMAERFRLDIPNDHWEWDSHSKRATLGDGPMDEKRGFPKTWYPKRVGL